jgi:hypothetical protein
MSNKCSISVTSPIWRYSLAAAVGRASVVGVHDAVDPLFGDAATFLNEFRVDPAVTAVTITPSRTRWVVAAIAAMVTVGSATGHWRSW